MSISFSQDSVFFRFTSTSISRRWRSHAAASILLSSQPMHSLAAYYQPFYCFNRDVLRNFLKINCDSFQTFKVTFGAKAIRHVSHSFLLIPPNFCSGSGASTSNLSPWTEVYDERLFEMWLTPDTWSGKTSACTFKALNLAWKKEKLCAPFFALTYITYFTSRLFDGTSFKLSLRALFALLYFCVRFPLVVSSDLWH